MDCTDEIITRIAATGSFTEESVRIVLHDYDITRKTTGVAVQCSDSRQKAVQMFIVTKKVEGCTDRTIGYYMGVLRRFFNEIDYGLEEIKTDHIRYYLAIRFSRDGLGRTSQNNELRALRSFFKWCTGEEYIQKNPTVNIRAVKEEKRIRKPFSETEMEMIRRSARTKRDSAIIEVLYSTGARVSELCGMDRQDVCGDEITVFGKGGKERIAYLNAKATLALHEYLEGRTDGNAALFVAENAPHGRMTKSGVEVMIRKTGERAGVPKCHPHRFRRTAATTALNRGMPLEQVQKMLGHEDIKTTTIYARSEQENVKTSHRKYVV